MTRSCPILTTGEPRFVREVLERHAFLRLSPEAGVRVEEVVRDPWAWVERLIGERPRMLERQPIKAVEGGKSFASSSRFTPLHTDSQLYDGAPPDLQIMVCIHADEHAGESSLLDTWPLLEQIERQEPSLFGDLFFRSQIHSFVFGDLYGPTVAIRGSALAFTHSPRFAEQPIGRRLLPWIERTAPLQVAIKAGEILLLDNRRALHGRASFLDRRREFIRLLVWLPTPMARHERYEALAWQEYKHTQCVLMEEPAERRRRAGIPGAALPSAEERWALVAAMLRGVAPGVLATKFKIAEPELYVWRDEAIRAALEALARGPRSS